MFYLPNGTIKEKLNNKYDFYVYEFEGSKSFFPYDFPKDEIFYDLENVCVSLYDLFQDRIFTDRKTYYEKLPSTPIWISDTGINSDNDISKFEFEHLVQSTKDEWVNRQLFKSDCFNLIGYLQSRILGVRQKIVLFYINFCKFEPFQMDSMLDGVWNGSGENTTIIFSLLTDLISNLFSIMDLTTKIIYHFENLPSDFKTYPKWKSNIQFGNHKKIKNIKTQATIFEDGNLTINLIQNLRHELIHNGYWESIPKIFINMEAGEIIEKWIYLPDHIDGRLLCAYNRKRFYSMNLRINEELPSICLNFLTLLLNTLNSVK